MKAWGEAVVPGDLCPPWGAGWGSCAGAEPCAEAGVSVSMNVDPPLQVLNQVLAVTGVPRVPEEHDVWSEVQALQVRMRGLGTGAESTRQSEV